MLDAAAHIYRDVMTVDPPPATTPLEQPTLEFVSGHVWSRPGLSQRDRRRVILACVAAADEPAPEACLVATTCVARYVSADSTLRRK